MIRCNETNVPLILYLTDFPYTAYTNGTALGGSLTNAQVTLLTSNALALVSQANNTLRADWSSCIACGALHKSLAKLGIAEPQSCSQCWADYCWNGQIDQSQPSFLDPYLVLDPTLSYEQWNTTVFYSTGNSTAIAHKSGAETRRGIVGGGVVGLIGLALGFGMLGFRV